MISMLRNRLDHSFVQFIAALYVLIGAFSCHASDTIPITI